MKKNNPYITDNEIDLGALIRALWKEKILILSISIICGLLGYLYASFKPEEFKAEIKIKNPPLQLFEDYTHLFLKDGNKINEQFISDFKLNFLSLDNVESFVEESRDLDDFRRYLKSQNISVKEYFREKLVEAKEKNIIIPNTYALFLKKKKLDGDIFLNNYVEFIKKKTFFEFKKKLKLLIEHRIKTYEDALEIAKLINLENPLFQKFQTLDMQAIQQTDALMYRGIRVLSRDIDNNIKLLKKIENEQFNYNAVLDKGIMFKINTKPMYFYFSIGLFIGFFLSCIIIYFKTVLKNK
jgi:LPS O-antigen subunit length determinant protein (WzzB/FepE family)